MPSLTRRKFLAGCAGVGATGALAAASTYTWSELMHIAESAPLSGGAGILVLVTMYGGNDGINTVIPLADDAYYDARPELAYSPDELIALDDGFGLNPAMSGVAAMFKARNVAIVRGVGYPAPDRSHFRSMDIWQSASTDNEVKSGWIGRWLDAGGDPLGALNIGSVLPTLAIGDKVTAAALSSQVVPPKNTAQFLSMVSKPDKGDNRAMALVRDSYRAVPPIAEVLSPIFENIDEEALASESGESSSGLDVQLNAVARCISAGLPTRVYSVSIGGFDTHSEQRDDHRRLIGVVDGALTRFMDKMRENRYGKNLVLMAYSEFGRRVAANASDGTDHGTSGPVFLIGNNVRGGYYGDEPSLTDLDEGNLKVTTDFRDIYSELIGKTLASDPEPVLGAARRELNFLKT